MSESTLHVAILSLDIHIPDSGSLKSKRMVLRSLKDRLHSKFNVSVAEVAGQDKWQRSEICICMIGSDKSFVDSCMQGILSYTEKDKSFQVIDHVLEFV